jgi:hypothetical protein
MRTSAVEIVDGGKARRQPVEVGYEDDKFAEIVSGLKGDEQVILQGAYALPDGTPVTATAAAEKSENGAASAKSGDEEKGADPGAEKPAGPEKK